MSLYELNAMAEFIFRFGPIERFVPFENPLWKVITDCINDSGVPQKLGDPILHDGKECVRLILSHGAFLLEVEPAIPA